MGKFNFIPVLPGDDQPIWEQKILAVGGILLVVGGMGFGELLALFIVHSLNDRIAEALVTSAQLIPLGDADGIMVQFQAIGALLENRGTKIDAHSHAVHLGYIALLLAILQPWTKLSPRLRKWAACLFAASAVLLPLTIISIHYVGLSYSPFSYIGWASVVADFLGMLLVLSMFMHLWGIGHNAFSNRDLNASKVQVAELALSRLLLSAGLFLLVCGFLYGLGYAAWLQYGQGLSEVEILKSIVTNAQADQQSLVAQDFATYGHFQMLRTVNVSVHAHINELGILLLMLSFLQRPLVNRQTAQIHSAWLIIAGAFLMPVGILLAIPFGSIGGVVSNLAGIILIAGVLAMFAELFFAEDAK